MVNLETMVGHFTNTEKANDAAVEIILGISARGMITSEEAEQLQNNLSRMKESYSGILRQVKQDELEGMSRDAYYVRLNERFVQAQKRIRRNTVDAEMLGEIPGLAVSPQILSYITGQGVDHITALNPKLYGESADSEEGKITDVKTPHDFVRYLHKKSVETIFDPTIEWDTQFTAQLQSSKVYVGVIPLRKEKELELTQIEDPFLQHLTQLLMESAFSYLRAESKVNILYDTGKLSHQLNLGCHYARLMVTHGHGTYQLKFKYTDTTTYTSSDFRAKFTETLLQMIGLETKRDMNVVMAEKTTGNLDEAIRMYESILRASFSLRDLDMIDNVDLAYKRRNDLLKAFFMGVTNLRAYMNDYSQNTAAQYLKDREPRVKSPPGVKSVQRFWEYTHYATKINAAPITIDKTTKNKKKSKHKY